MEELGQNSYVKKTIYRDRLYLLIKNYMNRLYENLLYQ